MYAIGLPDWPCICFLPGFLYSRVYKYVELVPVSLNNKLTCRNSKSLLHINALCSFLASLILENHLGDELIFCQYFDIPSFCSIFNAGSYICTGMLKPTKFSSELPISK